MIAEHRQLRLADAALDRLVRLQPTAVTRERAAETLMGRQSGARRDLGMPVDEVRARARALGYRRRDYHHLAVLVRDVVRSFARDRCVCWPCFPRIAPSSCRRETTRNARSRPSSAASSSSSFSSQSSPEAKDGSPRGKDRSRRRRSGRRNNDAATSAGPRLCTCRSNRVLRNYGLRTLAAHVMSRLLHHPLHPFDRYDLLTANLSFDRLTDGSMRPDDGHRKTTTASGYEPTAAAAAYFDPLPHVPRLVSVVDRIRNLTESQGRVTGWLLNVTYARLRAHPDSQSTSSDVDHSDSTSPEVAHDEAAVPPRSRSRRLESYNEPTNSDHDHSERMDVRSSGRCSLDRDDANGSSVENDPPRPGGESFTASSDCEAPSRAVGAEQSRTRVTVNNVEKKNSAASRNNEDGGCSDHDNSDFDDESIDNEDCAGRAGDDDRLSPSLRELRRWFLDKLSRLSEERSRWNARRFAPRRRLLYEFHGETVCELLALRGISHVFVRFERYPFRPSWPGDGQPDSSDYDDFRAWLQADEHNVNCAADLWTVGTSDSRVWSPKQTAGHDPEDHRWDEGDEFEAAEHFLAANAATSRRLSRSSRFMLCRECYGELTSEQLRRGSRTGDDRCHHNGGCSSNCCCCCCPETCYRNDHVRSPPTGVVAADDRAATKNEEESRQARRGCSSSLLANDSAVAGQTITAAAAAAAVAAAVTAIPSDSSSVSRSLGSPLPRSQQPPPPAPLRSTVASPDEGREASVTPTCVVCCCQRRRRRCCHDCLNARHSTGCLRGPLPFESAVSRVCDCLCSPRDSVAYRLRSEAIKSHVSDASAVVSTRLVPTERLVPLLRSPRNWCANCLFQPLFETFY